MANETEKAEVTYDAQTGIATIGFTVEASKDKNFTESGTYIAHDPENPAAFADYFVGLSTEEQGQYIKDRNYGANLRSRALARAKANTAAEGPDKAIARAMAALEKLPADVRAAMLAKLSAGA